MARIPIVDDSDAELISHVSHELRTPLASLTQLLSIVLDGLAGPISAEQREFLAICLRDAKQLRSMIADLMEVTRVQNGKLRVTPRPLELSALIDDVARSQRPAAQAKGISIETHSGALPTVLADDVRVRQVLTNLVDNAIKYSPEDGAIEIAGARDASDPAFVRIAVRDTGSGVAPEARERIFDSMQQEQDDVWRSRKGLGIGLYLCRELVTRQGGRIWVESERAEGSSFCFTLPAFDFARDRGTDSGREPMEPMNMQKILVVDDDSDIRLGLKVRLRASGYATAFAADGVNAISTARKERPDLILLDLGLPAGDGFQVLERLKTSTEFAHVPVIVLSARDAEGNERRALKSGAAAYLQKPVDDDDLLEAIATALR